MTDNIKINNITLDLLELVEDENIEKDALAAVSLSPLVSWAKFVLTDSKPNANNQRVPKEEFANLIKTGLYMPIKMAYGQINEGHENAFPLGVITNLKEENDKIIGLAALWKKERPEDINLLKEMYKTGKQPQFSWEISYTESSVNEGIEDLRGVALRAATLVGMPAYEGRTPIVALASKTKEEESTLEELEQLKAKVAELEALISQKDTELAGKDTEIASLSEFKNKVESERVEAEKFSAIKTKFQDAGIEKTEEYFNTNKSLLLGLDENALNFMVQELVSLKDTKASTETKEVKSEIPPIVSDNKKTELKDIVQALRERTSKK